MNRNTNALLINGYDEHPFAPGQLNSYIANSTLTKLRQSGLQVQITATSSPYNVDNERNKFFWADLVIVQFPVYWFSAPAGLKRYLDEVFEYQLFYSFGDEYGTGGLLSGKRYCLSSTWNAPEDEFGKPRGFFDGKSVDDVLIPLHKAFQFCGLKNLVNLSLHNVVKQPQAMDLDRKLKSFVEGIRSAYL